MSRLDADIAIVGAGPAGQVLALALAQSGFEIALVDAAPGPAPTPTHPDLRVFALSPASIQLLVSVGAWPVPLVHRVCAYRYMHVWEGDPGNGIAFDAAHSGLARLGIIVEHGVLQHALASRLATTASVRDRWGARIDGLEHEADAIVIQLDNGGRVRTRLVVGADGAASPIRQLAGIATTAVDYGRRALVANVRTSLAHERTARQRFLPGGPLAFLPLPDADACSIVWSVKAGECERLQSLPVAEFERELSIASGGVLGNLRLDSERVSFPLMRQLASAYHADRVALVGDAAHVVHPLAGQGLNLGLLDVAALTDVLVSAKDRHVDIGDNAVLARYARWRQGDNTLAAHAFETIDRYYRAGGDIAKGMRALGHRIINRQGWLKRQFTIHAAGLGGRVPSRCKPMDAR